MTSRVLFISVANSIRLCPPAGLKAVSGVSESLLLSRSTFGVVI